MHATMPARPARRPDNAPMLHVILHRPEIPPNTGNVIRLCANSGAALHLVRPLGFELDDARLRRAGLDYHEYARVAVHDDLQGCLTAIGAPRLFAFTTRGRRLHTGPRYADGDALLFGCETAGLPATVLEMLPETQRLCLPMQADSRSLNLSNAVAIAVYEAWRQLGFAGAAPVA
jgi:tRNA (cytidine/uridine-2'-O-)-methyltransferase